MPNSERSSGSSEREQAPGRRPRSRRSMYAPPKRAEPAEAPLSSLSEEQRLARMSPQKRKAFLELAALIRQAKREARIEELRRKREQRG